MTGPVLRLDDLELRLDGTTVWITSDGIQHQLSLRTIGESEALAAVDAMTAAVDSGTVVADAIGAATAAPPRQRHMQQATLPNGAALLDDTHGATKDDMAAALRSLVQVAPRGSRTLAVLGEFDCDPVDLVEQHDAIGRLVVRLNVNKLVAVGAGARHLQSAAGLEGSWDGESLIVGTPEEAYDLLRDEIRENDVVLVKGAPASGLSRLVDQLTATGANR